MENLRNKKKHRQMNNEKEYRNRNEKQWKKTKRKGRERERCTKKKIISEDDCKHRVRKEEGKKQKEGN
jgi:hypothetical protein